MRAFFLSLGILISAVCSAADTVSQSWGAWEQAKALYDNGKYDEALQSLRSAPQESANYYFNIGTVSYQLGQHGRAVAYLEKANRLRPHDSALQHNLRLARSQLERKLGEDRLDPASSWTEKLADHLPFDEVRGILGMVGIVLILFWARAYWRSRNILRTLVQPAAILTGLAFALTLGLYMVEKTGGSHHAAIVLDAQVIRSGPGEQFLDLARVESGTKLRILSESNQWRQIRFGGDDIGWVPASSLLLL